MKHSGAAATLLAIVIAVFGVGNERAEAAPISTQTFDFSGTVGFIDDPGNVTGLHLGDNIVGTLTFDPLVDTYTSTTTAVPAGTIITHSFAESGKFTFGKPGSPLFEVDGGSGSVDSSVTDYSGASGLNFIMTSGIDWLSFGTGAFFSSQPLLTSLTQLPADSTGLAAFFGGHMNTHLGASISYQGVEFQIVLNTSAPITRTPIPATAWLFSVALSGLALLGRMRGEYGLRRS